MSRKLIAGAGVLISVVALWWALRDIKFAYHVGIEHEKDPKDPVPGLAESVGYAKGVMR